MHNIDRTQFEADEFESGVGGEFEQSELELPLHETQELELASSLLEVSNEMELEQFLGDLFRAVGRAAGQFARSGTGRALGGILKNTIQQALPVIGGGIGPALGGPLGGGTAQQAGSLLGLELEGLSPQDQEFETARQLVRLASSAYRNAAWAPRTLPPTAAARSAALTAARRFAPGLLRTLGTSGWGSYRRGWQGRRYGYGVGSGYRYGSTYGYRPQYGYGGYGSSYRAAPWYGSGWRYGYGQPSFGSGYNQPGPWYWRRQPWYSRRRRSWYPWGYGGYQPSEPDAGAFVQSTPEPPPPPPIAVPEPSPGPPPAAEPTPAAAAAGEPASSSEFEFLPGANGWHPGRAVGGRAARNGRWVRRGGVLVVYGA
jgi:hypothetical protein